MLFKFNKFWKFVRLLLFLHGRFYGFVGYEFTDHNTFVLIGYKH